MATKAITIRKCIFHPKYQSFIETAEAIIWTEMKQGFSVLVYILEHNIPIGTAKMERNLKYWFK